MVRRLFSNHRCPSFPEHDVCLRAQLFQTRMMRRGPLTRQIRSLPKVLPREKGLERPRRIRRARGLAGSAGFAPSPPATHPPLETKTRLTVPTPRRPPGHLPPPSLSWASHRHLPQSPRLCRAPVLSPATKVGVKSEDQHPVRGQLRALGMEACQGLRVFPLSPTSALGFCSLHLP